MTRPNPTDSTKKEPTDEPPKMPPAEVSRDAELEIDALNAMVNPLPKETIAQKKKG